MRSTLAGVAILIFAGTGVFWAQRSQIVQLRAQIARQGDALENNQKRVEDLSLLLIGASGRGMGASASLEPSARARGLRRSDDNSAALRADERRVILDQYRDVLTEMDLPPATASRLQNLLTERIEAVLDAEDAAVREGFAEGSAETERTVTLAITEVDREITNLVGQNGSRLLDGLPSTASPEPAVMPVPAAPPAVVTVVVVTPAAPSYAESTAPPEASGAYPLYSPYLYTLYSPYVYYPLTNVLAGRRVVRPFAGVRTGAVRSYRR